MALGKFIDSLFHAFVSNPLLYLGGVLCALAVWGFLIFLRGFIAGSGHVLTNSGNQEHHGHAQARTVWGAFVLTAAFIFWELLRFVATVFGYDTANATVSIVLIVFVVVWCVFFRTAGDAAH